jgi:hypothetical protein
VLKKKKKFVGFKNFKIFLGTDTSVSQKNIIMLLHDLMLFLVRWFTFWWKVCPSHWVWVFIDAYSVTMFFLLEGWVAFSNLTAGHVVLLPVQGEAASTHATEPSVVFRNCAMWFRFFLRAYFLLKTLLVFMFHDGMYLCERVFAVDLDTRSRFVLRPLPLVLVEAEQQVGSDCEEMCFRVDGHELIVLALTEASCDRLRKFVLASSMVPSCRGLNSGEAAARTIYWDPTSSCAICLQSLGPEPDCDQATFVCANSCGHWLHSQCVQVMLDRNWNKCPLCQSVLRLASYARCNVQGTLDFVHKL